MDIDRNSPLPKHFQLGAAIKNDIIESGLSVGELIPSERTLSETFDVSRFTVRRAISDLVKEGILRREGRRGAFVNRIPSRSTSWGDTPRRKLLGVLIPDIEDFFAARLVNGMDSLGHQAGYSIALGRTDENLEKAMQQLECLLSQQVAGLVIVPVAGPDYVDANLRLFGAIRAACVPFVLVDRYVDGSDADTVVSDNFDGSYRSTEHLIQLGHTRIAYVGYPRCSATDDRADGYKKCLMDHHLYPDVRLDRRYHPRRDREQTIATARELLKLEPRATAILAANDGVAMDIWAGLGEMGLRVPQDVALVGYDNASNHVGPGVILTTTEQPLFEEGRQACKMLLDRIEGYDGPARFGCLRSAFVPGRSTVLPGNVLVKAEGSLLGAESSLG